MAGHNVLHPMTIDFSQGPNVQISPDSGPRPPIGSGPRGAFEMLASGAPSIVPISGCCLQTDTKSGVDVPALASLLQS